MRIHHTLRTISSVTATSAAAGFPADNVISPRIKRAWRSTSGGSQTVTLNFDSAYVESVWLQDTNIVSATVGGNSITFGTEQNGRRKGRIDIKATVSSIEIAIPSGSPAEGYWFIGAAYVFGAVYTMPITPQYGLRFETVHPGVSRRLPNGRTVTARTGPMLTRIDGDFRHRPSEDVGRLIVLSRASGVIGLDMALDGQPGRAWPCEYVEDRYTAEIESVAYDSTEFALSEVV